MTSSKYKLAAFDMDGTLLHKRSIFVVAEEIGIIDDVMRIIESDIFNFEKTMRIAKLLKGVKKDDFMRIVDTIPFHNGVEELIKELKRRGIKTAIISAGYNLASEVVKNKLGMDFALSNKLKVDKNGVLTGKVEIYNKNIVRVKNHCRSYSICKSDALRDLCNKLGISIDETLSIGDGPVDIYMLKKSGLSFAYRAPPEVQKVADIKIDNILDVLDYV